MIWDVIAGTVASNLVGKAMGGGKTQASTTPQTIPGAEFQPFTYTGANGFGVMGTPSGDSYTWSATLPAWLKDLGAMGGEAAGGMFQDYLTQVQKDPYAMAEEIYSRGYDVLAPEFAKRNVALKESLFGSGRLGQQVGGVNPLAYQEQLSQQDALSKLWASSLTQGQEMQTGRLNQLSQAADAMLKLGMTPEEVQQNLINFGANLEGARSTALKQGTAFSPLKETTGSVFAGELANTVGRGVQGMFNEGGYFSGPAGGFAGSQAEFDAFDFMPFDMIGNY